MRCCAGNYVYTVCMAYLLQRLLSVTHFRYFSNYVFVIVWKDKILLVECNVLLLC